MCQNVLCRQHNNAGAVVNASVIASLPLVLVLVLLSRSGPLRQTSWRPIVVDTMVTMLFIGVFQIAFYFLGQNWRYPNANGLLSDICKDYNHRFATENVTVDCASCMEKLGAMLDEPESFTQMTLSVTSCCFRETAHPGRHGGREAGRFGVISQT